MLTLCFLNSGGRERTMAVDLLQISEGLKELDHRGAVVMVI